MRGRNRLGVLSLGAARRAATVLALVALAGGFCVALAQDSVSVQPPGLLLSGEPGQTLTATVGLVNPSGDPVTVRASLGDWSYGSDGGIHYYDVGSVARSAASWISVNPSTVDLDAHGNGQVRYSVSVPADAQPGTHWAVIFFETEPPNPPTGNTLATFRVRVGYIVYVNVGNGKASGAITGILGKPAPDGTRYLFAVQYHNDGTLVSLLNGRIDIRDENGDTVTSIPIEREVALPLSTRVITATIAEPLPAGTYNALVVLSAANSKDDVAGQYTFTLAKALAGRTSAGSGGAEPAKPAPPGGTP